MGLLRLRKCSEETFRPELKGGCSIVRELHVYPLLTILRCRGRGGRSYRCEAFVVFSHSYPGKFAVNLPPVWTWEEYKIPKIEGFNPICCVFSTPVCEIWNEILRKIQMLSNAAHLLDLHCSRKSFPGFTLFVSQEVREWSSGKWGRCYSGKLFFYWFLSLLACFFLSLLHVLALSSVFWLVHFVVCIRCDWSEGLHWVWFYDNQLKTVPTS